MENGFYDFMKGMLEFNTRVAAAFELNSGKFWILDMWHSATYHSIEVV